MKNKDSENNNQKKINETDRGLADRDRDYLITLRKTKNPRIAIRSYCAGNKWLTENAKAVGNHD